MEDSSTEDLSSTANPSLSGAGDGNASDQESGWTSYIDYFMETQRQQRQEEEASSAAPSADDVGRRSTSQYSGGCGVGGSSWLPALIEPSEASRRLSLKKEGRRKKKVMYDESLEDTATSPISSPNKLIELRESDANHQKKEDARDEFSHYKKTAAAELAGYSNLSNNGANTTTTDTIDDACAYDNNELRKKGLCLVPLSAFHV